MHGTVTSIYSDNLAHYGGYVLDDWSVHAESILLSGEQTTERKSVMHAKTFVGPTRENLVPDPLAVLHLDNGLYTLQNKNAIFTDKI